MHTSINIAFVSPNLSVRILPFVKVVIQLLKTWNDFIAERYSSILDTAEPMCIDVNNELYIKYELNCTYKFCNIRSDDHYLSPWGRLYD